MRLSILALGLLVSAGPTVAQVHNLPEGFPVEPEQILKEPFNGSEGIAFNGEGHLYVTANRGLWQVYPDGRVRHVADLDTHLGIASIGERDLLVADFGPTNAFSDDRNSDGVIWRITPEGKKTEWVTGFGDPNFILVRADGSLLVTDDATADIYVVGEDLEPRLFSPASPSAKASSIRSRSTSAPPPARAAAAASGASRWASRASR